MQQLALSERLVVETPSKCPHTQKSVFLLLEVCDCNLQGRPSWLQVLKENQTGKEKQECLYGQKIIRKNESHPHPTPPELVLTLFGFWGDQELPPFSCGRRTNK